jgi:hypothetical protein
VVVAGLALAENLEYVTRGAGEGQWREKYGRHLSAYGGAADVIPLKVDDVKPLWFAMMSEGILCA